MINIGIIGLGFMGVTHYKALQKVKGARVTTISTRDATKLAGDWRGVKGNFGEDGGVQDVSRLARYAQTKDLLADKNVDIVSVCLPTHLHRDVTIKALQAGKHVLVEKPIALNLKDADTMIAAARKAERQLMVGQVLRFFPAFEKAHEIVHSKKYGALLGAHFKRVISAPAWSSDDHFADAEKSGGPGLDLHIHDTDFVTHLAGAPQSVRASGIMKNNIVTFLNTQYSYPRGGPCITSQSGAIAMPSLMFEHGYDIYLENATLAFNNLYTGEDIWLFGRKGEKKVLRPRAKDAFVAQWQHAVECVASNRISPLIDASIARQSLAICLKEQDSVRTEKVVRV